MQIGNIHGGCRNERNGHETLQAETEMRSEAHRSGTRPRRWSFSPRRDVVSPRPRPSVAAPKTLAVMYGKNH